MKRISPKLLILSLILVCLCISIFLYIDNIESTNNAQHEILSVTVIDVGQGDSILVNIGHDTMLIDAAEKSGCDAVIQELNEQGIEDIDILVATHPHSDHIGGMKDIVDSYNIGIVYMADTDSQSKTYKTLISDIESKGVELREAYAGLSFNLGGAVCTIVAPAKSADDDANNESVVIFIDYLDSEFLLTGDMEKEEEHELLESNYIVDADVIKIAHHGSNTGTSEAFLIAVSPEYAIISCGEGNSYGHPHKETISLLSEYKVKTLRTDYSGDVTFSTDGKVISVNTEK